jgi:hypothetical protein
MARKVIAAIVDVSFVKKYRYGYTISKVKKFLVYDPKIVAPKLDKKKEADI